MESDGKIRFLRLSEFLRTESDEVHPISITQISGMIKQRRGFDLPPPRKEEKRNRVPKMRNKN